MEQLVNNCDIVIHYCYCVITGTSVTTVYANGGPGNGVIVPAQQSWQELLNDKVTTGWYQDQKQQTLWLKLGPTYINATILTSTRIA